jgi:hypothetical protein
MARRGISQFLIGLMIVLNGTVIVLGPGLHAFSACGHHAVATTATGADDGLRVAVSGDDASTCPVCDYLAQGQVVAERAHAVASSLSTPSILSLPAISAGLRPWRTFGCRAPPAAYTL